MGQSGNEVVTGKIGAQPFSINKKLGCDCTRVFVLKESFSDYFAFLLARMK